MKAAYLSLLLFSVLATSQTIQQIDSVTVKMCETLQGFSNVPDSLKIQMMYRQHMPAFSKMVTVNSQKEADELNDRLFFRMQKNCEHFVEVLSRLETGKGDWARLPKKPSSTVPAKDCEALGNGKKYYYKEYGGGIVNVEIANGIWRETFADNTVSILNYTVDANCEFTLEFIRSDNQMRKNLSVKGDKYQYGLYEKKNGVYSVYVKGEGEAVDIFKLYPAK